MVDNRQPEAERADGISEETTPLACRSSTGSAVSQLQDVGLRLNIKNTAADDDCQKDAVIDDEDDKSTCATLSADASDDLRQIVIDGSNIAMRFELYFIVWFYSLIKNEQTQMSAYHMPTCMQASVSLPNIYVQGTRSLHCDECAVSEMRMSRLASGRSASRK